MEDSLSDERVMRMRCQWSEISSLLFVVEKVIRSIFFRLFGEEDVLCCLDYSNAKNVLSVMLCNAIPSVGIYCIGTLYIASFTA